MLLIRYIILSAYFYNNQNINKFSLKDRSINSEILLLPNKELFTIVK